MKKTDSTKNKILNMGLAMASQLGLENVTIGQLALKMQMSKSGLFSHFNSKENLQIAILEYAGDDFKNYVLLPSLESKAGIPRIKTLVQNWIDWGERLIGGCIFVTASIEYSDRPGKVRDLVLKLQEQWIDSLQKIAESAIKAGDFRKEVSVKQFAYEVYSLLLGFHYYHRMLKDKQTKKRQQTALNQLLVNYQASDKLIIS